LDQQAHIQSFGSVCLDGTVEQRNQSHPRAPPTNNEMSYTIKREHKAITSIIRGDGIGTYVMTEQMPASTTPEFASLKVGDYVKFYNRARSYVVSGFGTDAEIGKITAIDVSSINVRNLDGRELGSIYLHHIVPATDGDVANAMFKRGDKVVVLDGSTIKDVQIGSSVGRHWTDERAALVGKVFTVGNICWDGDVQLTDSGRMLSPEYLRKATADEIASADRPTYKKGDSVVLLDGRKISAKRGSSEARAWREKLTPLIGTVSKVHTVSMNDEEVWLSLRVDAVSADFVRRATSAEIDAAGRFVIGDSVVVLDGGLVRSAGGKIRGSSVGQDWTTAKMNVVGQTFNVTNVCGDGDIVLSGATFSYISPDYLRRRTPAEESGVAGGFTVGDYVVCDKMHKHEASGVGWTSEMTAAVGDIGQIVELCDSGRYRVKYPMHGSWVYKPEWLRRVAPNDSDTTTLLSEALTAFKGSSPESKTAALTKLTKALGKRKAEE